MAADTWTVRDRRGRRRRVRIEVGQPQPVPLDRNEDWFCPVFIEGYTPHVVPAFGVGPIDSLMNAAILLRGFREYIAFQHIDYGKSRAKRSAGEGKKRKKKIATRRSGRER
jgi:hypothetical protein